jgi:hypothetical protein
VGTSANEIDEDHRLGQAILHFCADVLKAQNDRTAIIVATSMLEMQLEDLLKAFLQPPRKQDDELFRPERPLSTFSAKISLSYRLGVLDSTVCALLDGIRKIRNDFAHDIFSRSLNDPPHSDRINDLAARVNPELTDMLSNAWSLPDTPSGKIRALSHLISAHICYLQGCVKKPISVWETQASKNAQGG